MNEQSTPQPESTLDPTPDAPVEASRPRLRDRGIGLRGVVAVGAATLVLGGLGGTALGFALDGDRADQPGMFGRPVQMGGQMMDDQMMGGQMMDDQMMGGQMMGGQMGWSGAPGQGTCGTEPDSNG